MRKKTNLAAALAHTELYHMKNISKTMGVSRSQLYERRDKGAKVLRCFHRKSDNTKYLAMIRKIIAIRTTYGYRRVSAIMNRKLEGHAFVNQKRIYRLMKMENLLLQKSSEHPVRSHNGRIMNDYRNLRLCSDIFEINCWNKEQVRVAFSLDCCDREVISHGITTRGINVDLSRDPMHEAVAVRFGYVLYLPHPVEWLSDNGLVYISEDKHLFADAIGLRSIQPRTIASNQLAWQNLILRPLSATVCMQIFCTMLGVLERLPKWFEDYNEYYSHKTLKMMFPRQFRSRSMAKL